MSNVLSRCFLFPDLNQGSPPIISMKFPPFKSLAIPPIIAPPTTTTPVRRIAPTLTFANGMPCKQIFKNTIFNNIETYTNNILKSSHGSAQRSFNRN